MEPVILVEGVAVQRAHPDADAFVGGPAAAPRGARGRAGRGARARRHPPGRCRPPARARGARPVPPVLRARPRPHQALAAVAPPRREVPGVHRARGRPPPHPAHARGRGRPGRGRASPGPPNLCVPLVEAIALAHDCGHGPAGHASEEAFSPYLPGGYDHAVYGADVTLAPLNLCARDARRRAQPLVAPAGAGHARG